MQLNQTALQRVRTAPLRAEAVATIFEVMARSMTEVGSVASELMLGYQQPTDVVADGDYVPVIVLALRLAQKPTTPLPAEGGTPSES